MKITLKTKNMPLIGLYIIFNTAIFLTLYHTGTISMESIELYFSELKVKDGLFFTMLSLIIIVIGGAFTNSIKEIIVFWKFKNRLPGCEAFSKHVGSDDRINIKELKKKIGKFPTNPTKQNRQWYEIFKSIQDKSIDKTHQDSLLCRELSMMSLLMLLLVIPIYIRYDLISLYYILFLIFEYLMVRFCAKNTAERLVVNTLSLYSVKNEKLI